MLLLPLRRSHRRYPIRKIISYCHRGKRFLTLTLNLGLGGVKINTHYNLPKGELLDFTLILGNTSIAFRGRTVYSHLLSSRQTVSGIQFVDLPERDQSLLQNHFTHLEEWPQKRGMRSAGKRTGARTIIRRTGGKRT